MDNLTPEQRAKCMRNIKSTNTAPEIRLRKPNRRLTHYYLLPDFSKTNHRKYNDGRD